LIASIPSPPQAVWYLGPFPIRAYAMCILVGIIVAIWIAQRRLNDRGGKPGQALDVAVWAVPFGIIGGRVYHVITDPELYFAAGKNPWNAFAIWHGGLGIWGAVALGIVGAWIGCRRSGVRLLDFADAAAPGIVLAQAIGRWGNYFNQELFGGPTSLPWGLQIAPANRPPGYAQYATFQPTFLYESLWCVLVALALVLVDRRFTLARGQIFALYGMLYTIGRGLIELLRTDHANHILGLRLNVWTSLIVFAISGFAFWRFGVRAERGDERGVDGSAEPVNDESVGTTISETGKTKAETGTTKDESLHQEPAADSSHPSQHSD
jgi:prolipoprotein diacylglyceryl transferase